MQLRSSLAIVVALALPLLLIACGGDDRPAECEEIVEACHEVDTGTGRIHECHEGAESDWTKAECVAMRADCLSTCAAAAVDGGTGDAAP